MKKRYIYQTAMLSLLLLALSLICLLKPADTFSDSERRTLAQFPAFSSEAVLSGDFMADFETASLDQFPARDSFRGLKSAAALYAFAQLDTNGLYTAQGHIAKSDYPFDAGMIELAGDKFNKLYDTYLADTDTNVYLSLIPDKHRFLAAETGRLAADFDGIAESMQQALPQMTYLAIDDLLSSDDYYRTDSHWKQESILDVADRLAAGMGTSLDAAYETKELTAFYGVYTGQLALPCEPDTLRYLTNDTLKTCTVTSYETGSAQPSAVYDLAAHRDAYDTFLGGADPLIIIENPNAKTDRELVIFRDSFGSSLAPLLVDGYAKVTLVDIRYIHSGMLGNFIEFDDQDVLFLYSTTMLASSTALK